MYSKCLVNIKVHLLLHGVVFIAKYPDNLNLYYYPRNALGNTRGVKEKVLKDRGS